MSLFEIILLALIHGLTEFLPISSSGHLVLANAWMGIREPGIITEITLQLGSLAAVLAYFRRDLLHLMTGLLAPGCCSDGKRVTDSRRLILAIAVGTVPVVIAGLAVDPLHESLFASARVVSSALLLSAAALLVTLAIPRGSEQVSVPYGGVIGLFQALALVPGISRSGMTIASGLSLGVAPDSAVRFSFLLSIPAILGATLLKLPEMIAHGRGATGWALLIGFFVSLAAGYGSIGILLRIVRRGRFGWFGVYCLLIGLAGLLWLD